MFIVFDLDGTMCDGSHKAHLLKHAAPGENWEEQEWDAWIAACIDDELIEPIAEVARAMIVSGHKVEFWTGRGENCRDVTQQWLVRHGFCPFGQPLRMRPHDEPTLADCAMKARYLDKFGRPDLIFEDRQSVVDMWRSHGIVCAQVAPGNY